MKASPKTEIAWLKADSRLVGYFDAPSLESKVTETTAWMDTGDYITFNAASLMPIRVSERKGRSKEYQGPGIAIDWIDAAEGPSSRNGRHRVTSVCSVICRFNLSM